MAAPVKDAPAKSEAPKPPPQKPATSPPPAPAPTTTTASRISPSRVSLSTESTGGSEPEHKGAPHPVNEEERMGFLCKLGILDTEPEKRFDDITRLCCLVFKTPIALVSLVDKDRQWFKSVQGLPVRETDRKSSFCAWTLLPEFPEVLVVENALEDVRFRNNPLVLGPPHIRFYAGCPLVGSNQLRLGSLCIIDNKPRAFDAESCNMLANMGEMVVREIEKDLMIEQQRLKSEQLYRENNQLIRALDCFSEGIMLLNMSLPTWPILFVNEAWERATGVAKDALTGDGFWTSFTTSDGAPEASRVKLNSAIEGQESFTLAVVYNGAGASTPGTVSDSTGNGGSAGGRRAISLQFRSAHNSTMDSYMPLVGIPSILAAAPAAGGPMYYFVTISTAGKSTSPILTAASQRGPAFTITDTKIDPFDDVKLGPLLGKGSYGRVYRGVWNGAQVAVKVLETVQQAAEEEVLEAVLGGQISHPNIVQCYKHCTRPMGQATDADNEGRTLLETWMVMEFCNKGGLSDAIERGWFRQRHSLFEPNYKFIILTAREVASAMTYLHSRNILHGDLTGNNVMLTASDRDARHFTAKVADFGLSRVLSGEAITTRSYGTITHMCPELLVDGLLSKAADVYSFGVIMWELYTGQRPYGGLTHGQILHAITTGKPLSLGANCPQVRCRLDAPGVARPTDRFRCYLSRSQVVN
ncbi:hypothetical protein GPECTOR_15g370 [Gonium pectorale]|uniref:Protein kinase domain-containing protein n=1 Tax=Gonium pectorale TaxID=33097 RepID=A0A150GLF0_GONPE|nr:hypothetical protein GPECTOR_15g370 [Gonium pectorale]|eukprot:KXZ50686.1 hypothetical protein GPECTOR_15g370 [Gonium pectorale]